MTSIYFHTYIKVHSYRGGTLQIGWISYDLLHLILVGGGYDCYGFSYAEHGLQWQTRNILFRHAASSLVKGVERGYSKYM